ncbi:hypothetical protein R5O87_15580 [Arthrobacter globiformis]|uniref:hypothetical protein n=1 Tax=Arthrobacter globiformis TaxID=1665 RepID=UPI00397B93D8
MPTNQLDRPPSGGIHPLVAKAFEALEEWGAPWMLLRGENDLARPAGDVDILVAEKQPADLDSLMREAGFHRVVAPGHGTHRFYFSYAGADDLWVKLDIVTEIAFGPYQQWRTPLGAPSLARRIRTCGLWLPAPADQAWLQLLHLVMDKGQIPLARAEAAGRAAGIATADDAVAQFLDQRLGEGSAASVLNAFRSANPGDVPAVAEKLRSAWTAAVPVGSRGRGAVNRALRLLGPALQGRSGSGLVVGVMAPDGAGKTSLLHLLAGTFPVPGKYVYMGMWSTGSWDPLLRRVPGGRLGKKMVRLARATVVARYHRVRGRLVLLDRLPYDAILPGSVDSSAGGRIAAALAFRLVPNADVVMVLDAPGEVMFSRKGEHSAEVLEQRRRAYLDLARRLPGSRVLDACQPLEMLRTQAADIVWGSLAGKAGSSGGKRPQQRKEIPG